MHMLAHAVSSNEWLIAHAHVLFLLVVMDTTEGLKLQWVLSFKGLYSCIDHEQQDHSPCHWPEGNY